MALLAVLARLTDDRPTLVDQALAFGYMVLPVNDFVESADKAIAGLLPELEAAFPDTTLPATGEQAIELVGPVELFVWPMTAGRIAFKTDTAIWVARMLYWRLTLTTECATLGCRPR